MRLAGGRACAPAGGRAWAAQGALDPRALPYQQPCPYACSTSCGMTFLKRRRSELALGVQLGYECLGVMDVGYTMPPVTPRHALPSCTPRPALSGGASTKSCCTRCFWHRGRDAGWCLGDVHQAARPCRLPMQEQTPRDAPSRSGRNRRKKLRLGHHPRR